MDLDAFEKSDMQFFVKVIDIHSATPTYISAKTNVFEKLKASSQCGPLSTEAIKVDGIEYIDGGTVPNELDIDLIKEYKDKLFIFIQSQKDNRLSKKLLYPLYLLVGHAITVLYGHRLGEKYIQELFTDHTEKLASYKNVIFIKNDMCYSSFCTDKKKLEKVYLWG